MATDSQKLNSLAQAEHDAIAYAKRVVVAARKGKTVSYEDTSFVTGDSPAILDVFTDLGENGSGGYITNDGNGNFKVEVSNDGSTYGGLHTLKNGETLSLNGMVISKLRITWVTDSSYRVLVGTSSSLEKTALATGDIEIGAVEIKNSTDDTRATVDANGLAVKATIKETVPTDSTKSNGSLVLTYDGSNQITNIAMTIGATTYNKTITWVAGNATAISVWT